MIFFLLFLIYKSEPEIKIHSQSEHNTIMLRLVSKGFSCTPDRNCHTFCLGDKIASHPGVLTQAKKKRAKP